MSATGPRAPGPRGRLQLPCEPFLIQRGFVQRTPRGRLLTPHAFRHLGFAEPKREPGQFGLFPAGDEEG